MNEKHSKCALPISRKNNHWHCTACTKKLPVLHVYVAYSLHSEMAGKNCQYIPSNSPFFVMYCPIRRKSVFLDISHFQVSHVPVRQSVACTARYCFLPQITNNLCCDSVRHFLVKWTRPNVPGMPPSGYYAKQSRAMVEHSLQLWYYM